MINEEKVKIMTKLAMYEQGKGRKYLPVSKYYRSDYIGLALIKNFFLVTIGYCLSVAAVAVYFGEYLLENIHKMNLIMLGVYIVIGYLIVLVAYSVLTYIQYSVQYYRAKKKKNLPAEETQEGIVNDSITGIQTENKRNLCTVRNVPASFIEICPCTGLFHLDQYQHGIYDCTG